jgi:hypothetical protein
MEAHAGTVTIGNGPAVRPWRRRLSQLRETIRRRRRERARRAHSIRMSGLRAPFVPGSEHTHLLPPPKAY